MRRLVPGLLAFLVLLLGARAGADELVVRVQAEEAAVRTGAGFSFRVVYVAHRGEVLKVLERATRGYWYRVALADGTFGSILGDQVLPYDIDMDAHREPPGFFDRVGDMLFGPSPLSSGSVSLTFSTGMIGGAGIFLFRPGWLIDPHLALEGFVGKSLGSELDVLYYGAGANAYLWPSAPITPFFALGGGGASSRRKADQFTVKEGDFSTANVGGGLLFAFKKRITLRFDFREHIIFDPNQTQDSQEYSGGLAIVF